MSGGAASHFNHGRDTLIEDPKGGKARQDSYILEFRDTPAEIAPLLGLS
jgi:hypothetical protein